MDQVPLNSLAPPFQIQNESTIMTNILSEPDQWKSPMVLLTTTVVYVRCVLEEFTEAHSFIDSGSM